MTGHLRHHPTVARLRLARLFEVMVRSAELVACFGEAGLAFERLAKRAHRPRQVALRLEHAPEALAACRGIGRVRDRAPERGARTLEIAALVKKQAEVLPCEGVVAMPGEETAIGPLGALESPRPMQIDGLAEHLSRGIRLRNGKGPGNPSRGYAASCRWWFSWIAAV